MMTKADARPAAWRTSRRSQDNAACVEILFVDGGALVRDTKNRRGAVLQFRHDQWTRFLHETINGLASCNGAAVVSFSDLLVNYGDGDELTRWHVRSVSTGETLHFRDDELDAFRLGAADGEFDPVAALAVAS